MQVLCSASGGLPNAARLPRRRVATQFIHVQRATNGSINPAGQSRIRAMTANASAQVQPATLPDTPQTFPIPEERLIQLAQQLFKADSGVTDDSLLADDFRFEFPVISLDREAYLKAVRSFGFREALPDIEAHPYHWRVDPYEPNRVWFTTRVTGTHTGTLKFGSSTYKATGRVVQGAPECLSYVFNEEGKCVSYTGGYVMDRRVGNTQGLGALFGILAAIGAPVPRPGSLSFKILVALNALKDRLLGLFSWGKAQAA